jgi:hypothetical protein
VPRRAGAHLHLCRNQRPARRPAPEPCACQMRSAATQSRRGNDPGEYCTGTVPGQKAASCPARARPGTHTAPSSTHPGPGRHAGAAITSQRAPRRAHSPPLLPEGLWPPGQLPPRRQPGHAPDMPITVLRVDPDRGTIISGLSSAPVNVFVLAVTATCPPASISPDLDLLQGRRRRTVQSRIRIRSLIQAWACQH